MNWWSKWELIKENEEVHFLQWNPENNEAEAGSHRIDIYKKVLRNGIIKHKVIYKTEIHTGIYLNI